MERVNGQGKLRNGQRLPLDLIILAVLLVAFILALGTQNSATDSAHPTPMNATNSTTTNETLCIEGYLPDGTYWSCE